MLFSRAKTTLPTPETALRGRATRPYAVPETHAVLGTPLDGPWPSGHEVAVFGLGCFWGAERAFWRVPGVHSTAVGYSGGITPNPTYEETCTGRTGHTEVVRVVFDPAVVSYGALLKLFWEGHDPTQGHRQGHDVGTTYRSAVYWTSDEQRVAAEASLRAYEPRLRERGYRAVTTEIAPLGPFYLAEDYHQQYLYKVPNGYCGTGGTGISCPVGVAPAE